MKSAGAWEGPHALAPGGGPSAARQGFRDLYTGELCLLGTMKFCLASSVTANMIGQFSPVCSALLFSCGRIVGFSGRRPSLALYKISRRPSLHPFKFLPCSLDESLESIEASEMIAVWIDAVP